MRHCWNSVVYSWHMLCYIGRVLLCGRMTARSILKGFLCLLPLVIQRWLGRLLLHVLYIVLVQQCLYPRRHGWHWLWLSQP